MLGLVVVGNDFHNLKEINKIDLSSTGKSVFAKTDKNKQVKIG